MDIVKEMAEAIAAGDPEPVRCSDCQAIYPLSVSSECPACKSGAYETLTAPAPTLKERMVDALKEATKGMDSEWFTPQEAASICARVAGEGRG